MRPRSHNLDDPMTWGSSCPTLSRMSRLVLTKRRAVDLCRMSTSLCRTS